VIQQNRDFSSDPHQNSRNFIRGKISGFWAQQSWNFWNPTCISEIMSIWNWCFSRGLDQKILGILLLEFQLIVTPLYLNIFVQYFAVKWKAPCWTNQHRKFFTGDFWTLVNRCYKATCFSCAFKHDDIINTCNSNSATSIDFIFLRAGVMDILLYLGHPCLFFIFRQKTYVYITIYIH